jgi:hypothetical protein
VEIKVWANRVMNAKSKLIVVISVSVFVITLSAGGCYWAGYATGNSSGWINGHITGSADSYKRAYAEGFDAGVNDGKKDALANWQIKGAEAAKGYIIDHTL